MKAERAEAKPQGTNSTNPPPPEEPRASGGALELVPGLEVQSGPLWRAVRDEAARGVKVPTDRILLAQCELLGRQGEVLIVGLPGRSATERAALRLRHPLATAVRIVLGRAVELDFINAADWPAPAHR